MIVRRLSWAGIEIETEQRRLLIDAIQGTAPLRALFGDPLWPPVAIASLQCRDFEAMLKPVGACVLPAEIVPELELAGLNARGVGLWETVRLSASKTVTITAVPAVDWRGEYQVSWVVDDGEHRIFHGGDTLWHGSWWRIVAKFSGFDAAFLPINGVVARPTGMEPSNLPATLTPVQATVAARLLKARIFCPIHYGQFDNSETYRQYPDLSRELHEAVTRSAWTFRKWKMAKWSRWTAKSLKAQAAIENRLFASRAP